MRTISLFLILLGIALGAAANNDLTALEKRLERQEKQIGDRELSEIAAYLDEILFQMGKYLVYPHEDRPEFSPQQCARLYQIERISRNIRILAFKLDLDAEALRIEVRSSILRSRHCR